MQSRPCVSCEATVRPSRSSQEMTDPIRSFGFGEQMSSLSAENTYLEVVERPRRSVVFDPTVSAALRRWIDEHDTPGTVYHLHNWHKVLSPSALGSLRKVASRLVVSTHDFFLACPNGGYFNFPRQQTCNLTPLGLACLGDELRQATLWS